MGTFPRGVRREDRTLEARVDRAVRGMKAHIVTLEVPESRASVRVALLEDLVERGARAATVLQLLNRDGESCYLCGDYLRRGQWQVDHIVPRKLGGGDHPNNLALACRTCNARKRDLIVAFDIADRRPVFRLP